MKAIGDLLLIISLLVLANGAVAFFLRYNFITQERYGPSLTPIYIIGAGIGVAVVGMIVKTVAQQSGKNK